MPLLHLIFGLSSAAPQWRNPHSLGLARDRLRIAPPPVSLNRRDPIQPKSERIIRPFITMQRLIFGKIRLDFGLIVDTLKSVEYIHPL